MTMDKKERQKPLVGKAILASLLGFAAFLILQILITRAIGLAVASLPFLEFITPVLQYLFSAHNGIPATATVFVAAVIAYFISGSLIEKIASHKMTESLAFFMLGIVLVLMQGLILALDPPSGGSAFASILNLFAGFSYLISGRFVLKH